jgi:hypothetical protein
MTPTYTPYDPEPIAEEDDTAPTAARPPSPLHNIAGWTYDADHHCNRHALARFGSALTAPDTTDGEGNPLHPVFRWEGAAADFPEVCAECLYEAVSSRPASHSDQDIDNHNAAAAAEPRQVVTRSGVQFMLPGEEPPAVKKGGDTEQTRLF